MWTYSKCIVKKAELNINIYYLNIERLIFIVSPTAAGHEWDTYKKEKGKNSLIVRKNDVNLNDNAYKRMKYQKILPQSNFALGVIAAVIV